MAEGGEGPAIGIDLGTTYSCVAVWRNGRAEVIPNEVGERIIPSCVAFTEYTRFIGESAKAQIDCNPDNTVYDVKRLMGRQFNDKNVQDDMNTWSFSVVNNRNRPEVKVKYMRESKSMHPEQISAMVLEKLKQTAENYLGMPVKDAIVTVPAHFNNSQRQATQDAGKIARLNVIRILNEPTAAAIAYGFDKNNEEALRVLVFDWGGGTFDVTILKAEKGLLNVEATTGDTHLGGNDVDYNMAKYVATGFEKSHKISVLNNKEAMRRIQAACEIAKRQLSTTTSANIFVKSVVNGIDASMYITREKFDELNSEIFNRTLSLVENALADAKLTKDQIDEIVLVGGSTRITTIQSMLQQFFNGKSLCKSVNPDEVVAQGAAIYAAVLTRKASQPIMDLLLLDVTPLSLGIETKGELMSDVVHRNTTIPLKITKGFTTSSNNQTCVSFKVFEGERKMTAENNLLGEFQLNNIPPAMVGVPKLPVTFHINADGILHVSAEVKGTRSRSEITIHNNTGQLEVDEIAAMVEDADRFSQYDDAESRRITARNQLERYIYTEMYKAERKDRNTRKNIKNSCTEGLKWLKEHQDVERTIFEQYQEELKRRIYNNR